MAPASEKTKKFTLGPASGWLPAVAAFLCLCLLAMAAMTLVTVNSERKTGQKANITGVSAQGVAGLRRLLEAKGYGIIVNRMEDGPLLEHGDLEIITLDADGGGLSYAYFVPETDTDEDQASASDMSSAAEAQSEASMSASEAASADSTSASVFVPDYTAQMIPNPERVRHILYNPLAKAVLVVAPKWNAGRMPQNPLWDQGPTPVPEATTIRSLSVLSPVMEQPVPEAEDGKPAKVLPPVALGSERKRTGNSWVTYDKPEYTLKREFTVVPPKKDAEKNNTGLSAQPQYTAVPRNITLTPVPGQTLLNAPLVLGRINGLQSISGPNLQPVLLGPQGEVILSRVIVTRGRAQPKVPVYLLSDPDLLNNQIFSDPQKVVSALTLIKALTPPSKAPKIVFNLTFNNLGFQHDLLHAMSRPPYIGVPLTLLVLALGLMWAAFSRFGPAVDAPMTAPLGRGVQVLADNAARLMAMTLKETKLAPAYALMVRDLVLKNRGHIQMTIQQNPDDRNPDDWAEQIGRISHTTDSFLDLKQQAERIITVHQLIDITLKLHAWKTEIDHARI